MTSKPGNRRPERRPSLRQRVTLTATFALVAVSIVLIAYAEIRSTLLTRRHEMARLNVQADLLLTMLDLYRERLGTLARRVAADPEVDAILLENTASPDVYETLEVARWQLPEVPTLVLYANDGRVLVDLSDGTHSLILPDDVAQSNEAKIVIGKSGIPTLAYYAPARRGDRIVGGVGAFMPVSYGVKEFFPDLFGLAFLDEKGRLQELSGEFPVSTAAIQYGRDQQARNLVLSDIGTRRLEVTLLPLQNEVTGVSGELALLRDITEMARREELLIKLAFSTVLIIIILSLGLLMRALRLGFRPLAAVVRLLETMIKGETRLRFRGMEDRSRAECLSLLEVTREATSLANVTSVQEIGTLLDAVERFRTGLHARNALVAVQEQLASARRIQQSLLPVIFDLHPGLEIHGLMRPAQEIGGDFFDIFLLENGRVVALVADVSGKGIAAALFAAQVSALLRAQCLQSDDLTAAVRSTNMALCERNPEDMFVSVVLSTIIPETGHVSFVNAGHCPPMIAKRNGEVQLIEADPEPVLGVLPELSWTQHHLSLSPDDRLLFYSDGFDEAQTNDGTFLGIREAMTIFGNACAEYPELSGDYLSKFIFDQINNFAAGAPQSDDITLVVLGQNRDH